ncbi:cytochrome c [Bordetella sp. FB-8]|uniref:c-type cytochrome n=1 Tax=Bordetella sp. FB-8 TaxID=1159870 RepID=UPI00036D2CDB|nr:cytochrome c [Bordetella sp. FB-8]
MREFAAVIGSTLILSLAALAAAPAHAQFARPQDAVKYRQSAMTLMAAHFGRLAAVARGAAPNDPAQVKENAHVLQMLASLPWSAYGPGMQGGDSKSNIWSNPADFKHKREVLQTHIAALSAAADAGDIAKLRAAVGAVGASCKACHDAYRK